MTTYIGITSRLDHPTDGTARSHMARSTYIEAVIAGGGVPFLIPALSDLKNLRSLYALADGILIPGGEDVDPAEYNESHHEHLGALAKERDFVELALARWCAEDKKPLFGICRGMQVINVALGGSLVQDLDSQSNAPGHTHREVDGKTNWEELVHSLALDPKSRIAQALGTDSIKVNSLHHQAIKDAAPGIQVVGRSDDGTIEAIELPDHDFYAGIQCHPEVLWQNVDPRWTKCFEKFVSAASQHKK